MKPAVGNFSFECACGKPPRCKSEMGLANLFKAAIWFPLIDRVSFIFTNALHWVLLWVNSSL